MFCNKWKKTTISCNSNKICRLYTGNQRRTSLSPLSLKRDFVFCGDVLIFTFSATITATFLEGIFVLSSVSSFIALGVQSTVIWTWWIIIFLPWQVSTSNVLRDDLAAHRADYLSFQFLSKGWEKVSVPKLARSGMQRSGGYGRDILTLICWIKY